MIKHQLLIGLRVFVLLGPGVGGFFRGSDGQKTEVATQAKWEPIFFKMIDERLAETGIPELRTTQMTGNDFEVRVWVGFSEKGEDGLILRHSSNQWSGIHLQGISRGPRVVSKVSNL